MDPASTSLRLRHAIQKNDVSLVERILKANPRLLQNPDFKDKSNTSLHLAAQAGHTELAELLISLGHDFTVQDTDNANESNSKDEGTSINTDGRCPLHLAASHHHVDLIELLCTNFPRTVNRTDKEGRSPLLLASGSPTTNTRTVTASGRKLTPQSTEDVRSIETLLKHGADVKVRDSKGDTCLHMACAWGNLKAVRVLVQAGADPHCANYAGWKPDAYSLTVQADVYFRNLVAESERRKAEEISKKQLDRKGNSAGRVRLVQGDDDGDASDSNMSEDFIRERSDSGRSYTTSDLSSSTTSNGLGIRVGARADTWRT